MLSANLQEADPTVFEIIQKVGAYLSLVLFELQLWEEGGMEADIVVS